jgi:predicted amidohydrolase
MRPRTSEVRPNAATAVQAYRNATASMTVFVIPRMQTCPCCKRRRTHTQFDSGKSRCRACCGK